MSHMFNRRNRTDRSKKRYSFVIIVVIPEFEWPMMLMIRISTIAF
ncbi:MAG TPA: hypothetical protein O0X23_02430 [Methanocorpusculum sp.]|nr:hypothetical protein [Methanocorpusculum sp.]